MSNEYQIHFTGLTAMSFFGDGKLKITNDSIKLSGRQLKYSSLLYRIVYNISLLAMFVVFFGFSFSLVNGLMFIVGVYTPTYIPTKHGPVALIVAFMLLYPVIVATSRLSKFFFSRHGEAYIFSQQILSIDTQGSQDDGIAWIDVIYRDKGKRHKLTFSYKPSVSKGVVASIKQLTLEKGQEQ